MLSWWGTVSYFNIGQIQIGNIENITTAYVASGSFGLIVRSKYIGQNTYTVRRNNFRSKPTTIHGPVHKSYSNYLYSRSHFSRLQQAVAKKIFYHLSQKVSYSSKIIDPVINGFSPNEATSHLHNCDHKNFTSCIRVLCLGFSSTSNVDNLYTFRISVVDKVRTGVYIYFLRKYFKRK